MSGYSQDRRDIIIATIASGETESDEIDLKAKFLCGLEMPSSLSSTQMTFQVKPDQDSTFKTYKAADGSTVTVVISADSYVGFLVTDFANVEKIKLIVNSAEGAEREFKLVYLGL